MASLNSDTLARSSPLYERVKRVIPPPEWATFADDVDAILELKRTRNAVILAHNYQTPEIFHGVADIVGDSLLLAREATKVDADIIVLAGVHFMAETAKLLNPQKTVLIPDLRAGCSLADSITAQDVRLMRQRYPGAPVVAYVNTSTAVKAESDICCTSGNALKVVESLGVERVIMLPDEYLAQLAKPGSRNLGRRVRQPHVAGVEPVGVRKKVLPAEGHEGRHLPALGEGKQSFAPAAPVEAAAGEHERALGRREPCPQGCDVLRMRRRPHQRPRMHRLGLDPRREHILRQRDNDRPREPGHGNLQAAQDRLGNARRIGDLRHPFGDERMAIFHVRLSTSAKGVPFDARLEMDPARW